MSVGFVIGKFMPPHRGHQQLIAFAQRWVKRLYVVVESVDSEPIPCTLRYQWMTQLFPQCTVLLLTEHQPQSSAETPRFWSIWQQTLLNILPEPIDIVFASEEYGAPLAEILDAQFVPVDIARQSIAISATQIRQRPQQHWSKIPPLVQRHFRKKQTL